MFRRIFPALLMALVLEIASSEAVEIVYENPDLTPYCGREVLKAAVRQYFRTAASATAGPADPTQWGEGTVPARSDLNSALRASFHAAKNDPQLVWLSAARDAIREGSQSACLVLCVVDVCARIENQGEAVFVPLPRLELRRLPRMGVRPTLERRPGQFQRRRGREEKATARKKSGAKPAPAREFRSEEPDAPSVILASTPEPGPMPALNWTSDFWGEAARFMVARSFSQPGYVSDAELQRILEIIAKHAAKQEVYVLFRGRLEAAAAKSFLDDVNRELEREFRDEERVLKEKLILYQLHTGNFFSRGLELLRSG